MPRSFSEILPFENFDAKDRRQGWLPNKAAETFRRVVEYLPQGGVFGFVLPQTILRSKQATEVRRKLLAEFEIAEIVLFADKVFRYGESESTVIIGRRSGAVAQENLGGSIPASARRPHQGIQPHIQSRERREFRSRGIRDRRTSASISCPTW